MKRLKISNKKAVFYTCTILAEVKIFGYDEAKAIGKRNPIISNYRPNHWFGNYQKIDGQLSKMFLMGNIELLEDEILQPEQAGLAEIFFVGIKENIDKIEVGFEWQMFEAPRLIGKGKVLEIWSKHESNF